MNATRVAVALRLLADAIEDGSTEAPKPAPSARSQGLRSATVDDSDWLDQGVSPLGRRKHMRLCKEGKFPSARKDGKSWFVRRVEIDEYITKHGRAVGAAANDVDHLLERFSEMVGQ